VTPHVKAKAKAALRDIADTLYRAASNSCREHRRYAELVDHDAADSEQRAARTAVRVCDEVLDEAVDLYEITCLEESGHADDAWWHKANMVWRGAKDYLRHQAGSRRLLRGGNGHSMHELKELRIEHELEASALLRLRQAIESYKAARPEVA
jgi:hypothetical protein